MNIPIKTPQEIKIMQEGGKKLSSIFTQLIKMIKPGINLLDIEEKAIQLIEQAGGKPAFAKVPNYHWATCLNVNEEIVHGVPKDYVLKKGDVLNIDIGLYFKGFNTDMSSTLYVENQKPKIKDKRFKEIEVFLETGREDLKEAIKQAKSGNRVGHISQKIQQIIEGKGYSVARNLTGHGIGLKLHEPPAIPCFLKGKIEDTPILKPGMAIAIEVIYCMGKPSLIINPQDKWTIRTKDGKISAVFEETIMISKKGALRLTKLPF